MLYSPMTIQIPNTLHIILRLDGSMHVSIAIPYMITIATIFTQSRVIGDVHRVNSRDKLIASAVTPLVPITNIGLMTIVGY